MTQRLVCVLEKTLAMAETAKAFEAQGFTPMLMSPEEFAKFYVAEAAKWAKVVNAIGLSQ